MKVESPTKRVIIVDDELASRQNLLKVIENFSSLEVIAEISDGKTAIKEILAKQPDIVFLDIEMPGVTGFEVAKATQKVSYQLVFLTAHQKYALDAFNTQAIDYLMKPARPELIAKSITKILRQESFATTHGKNEGKLILSEGGQQKVIDLEHINYIETMARYRCIHLTAAGAEIHKYDSVISSLTLDNFIEQLESRNFYRLHRSYIVNLAKVIGLRVKSRRHFLALSQCETLIPISRSLVKETKDKLSSL